MKREQWILKINGAIEREITGVSPSIDCWSWIEKGIAITSISVYPMLREVVVFTYRSSK